MSDPGPPLTIKPGEIPGRLRAPTRRLSSNQPPLASSLRSAGQVWGKSLGASLGLPQVAETGPDGVFSTLILHE